MKGRKGFTLIELLVVIIILGILIALAIPKFMTGQEAARVAEAKRVLGSIRGAEINYQQINGNYTDSFDALGADSTTGLNAGGTAANSKYWDYGITYTTGTSFEATATRNYLQNTGYLDDTVVIDQLGNVYGTHPYAVSTQ